jgi:hypothetical protein
MGFLTDIKQVHTAAYGIALRYFILNYLKMVRLTATIKIFLKNALNHLQILKVSVLMLLW